MGHFEYKGMGRCVLHGKEMTVNKIGLVAGGLHFPFCIAFAAGNGHNR